MLFRSLLSSGAGGYSLLDNMGVTASEFQQNVTYKRAIEGELAKTIESINGVSAASVQLAIPQQTVFTSEQQDPTASVFVNVATPLTSDQVAAVVHLVSAAYPGLKDDNVAIVDQNGDTLSAVGGSPTGTSAEQATDYEARTRTAVQTMLDRLVGPGNSTVTVAADISSSSGTTTSKTYTAPTQAPALSESSSSSTYSGGAAGGAASGVLGTDTTSTSSTGSGSGKYVQKQGVKNNALNETTTTQSITPGTLNRQTIAVALNSAVPGLSTTQIQSLVSTAAGVNATRGDIVSVVSVPFSTAAASAAKAALAQSAAAQKAAQMSQLVTAAVWVVGGLLAAVVLLILVRKLFRRPDVTVLDAGALNVVPVAPSPMDAVLNGSAPTAVLGTGGMSPYGVPSVAAPTVAMPQAVGAGSVDQMQADVDALAGADPERTADYLRALMADGARA